MRCLVVNNKLKKIWNMLKKEDYFYKYSILVITMFVAAINYNLFLRPLKIVAGGTNGLSIIVEKIFAIEPSTFILVFSIAVLVLGYFTVGIKKASSALVASFVYPVFVDATEIITSELTGKPSPVPALKEQNIPNYGVKEAAFPFNMFQEVDPVLGPEMRSTGEVLGLSSSYGEAFFKAQEGIGSKLPLDGTVLISVNRKDKEEIVDVAAMFHEIGFKIIATGNTYELISGAGIPAEKIKKLSEGRPNTLDVITNGKIDLIINSPVGKDSVSDDSYLRKAAIKAKVPYMTTIAAAKATAEGIKYVKTHEAGEVKSLQELHAEITDK